MEVSVSKEYDAAQSAAFMARLTWQMQRGFEDGRHNIYSPPFSGLKGFLALYTPEEREELKAYDRAWSQGYEQRIR